MVFTASCFIFTFQHPQVLDGETRNGTTICIKWIEKKSREAEILQFLSSDLLSQDARNHTVPLLDIFYDSSDPEAHYLVMPLLRPYNDPEFSVMEEAIDFTCQILEVSISVIICKCL